MRTENSIQLSSGYSYQKVGEISLDAQLCHAKVAVFKDNQKLTQEDEFPDIEELIDSLMEDDFFSEWNINKYSSNGNVIFEYDNIYWIYWVVTLKFIHKYKQLQEYCVGKAIKVLSGNLKNRVGIYDIKKTGTLAKKIEHYVVFDDEYYALSGVNFEFFTEDDQLTWESIMEI